MRAHPTPVVPREQSAVVTLGALGRAAAARVVEGDELATHDMLLRGVRVTYFDEGPEDAPPVLLLHGLGESRRQWLSLACALLARHRVIALDFPGFGDSETPSRARWSYESLAETALDLLAALRLGRVAIVGHSMGAGVAIVAAADRPEFVERLVLVSAPCYRAPRALAERLVTLPLVGASIFKRLLGNVALMHRSPSATPGEAAFAMMRRDVDPSTLEARLPRVRASTLVVWGRDDRVHPSAHGLRLSRELNGARLEILECGHMPAAERSSSFNALVAEFLAEPPRPRLEPPAKPTRLRARPDRRR